MLHARLEHAKASDGKELQHLHCEATSREINWKLGKNVTFDQSLVEGKRLLGHARSVGLLDTPNPKF